MAAALMRACLLIISAATTGNTKLLQRVGFSNIEILRCATINNAKILRMEDKIGSLEIGKYADMVVLDKNPLEDIRALRKPQMVFKQGGIDVFLRKSS